MKLILSDRPLELNLKDDKTIRYIDLSSLKIENCVGCFGCWTKTPGKCVIRDDAVSVYPLIAKSREVLYISHVKYGGYDTIMKTMLERAIPIQQAFIRELDRETHHVQRAVSLKRATIIAYGELDQDEKEVFCQLVERNAKNMNFDSYHIIFSSENELEKIAKREVEKWKES